MPDSDTSRSGGELLPLHSTIDDGEIALGSPRLELLNRVQEAEAVALLAALFDSAARRREAERAYVRKAA